MDSFKKRESRRLPAQNHIFSYMKIMVLICLITACAPFTPSKRNQLDKELPANFSLYTPSHPPAKAWWTNFDSPELNRLMTEALGKNFSIREAKARLDQAQAVAMKSGAQRLPQLNFDVNAVTGRTRTESGGETSLEEYNLELSAGYEIDLWGRVRSQQQAALLDEAAIKEDLYAAGMTLAAEVAQRWISIITQRMEQNILAQQLEINQTLQELVDLRFRNGMVSALDVYQQKQAVSSIMASLPLVELEETLQLQELALLLGRSDISDLNIVTKDLPVLKGLPPVGIPADLLASRPDVRAAGLRLHSADWTVAASKADRLPALNLTAQAAYSSTNISTLFDNWLLNLIGSLTGPIFDGNSRKAEVLRTRAAAEELVATYGKVVFTAIKEVEDVLIQEEKHRQHLSALEKQFTVSKNALREARERYSRGLNDYLPVLTQLLSVQGLERDILQMKQQLILDRIGLYRSLGGSWPETLLAP
jgi:NodT family efflux transporter outer membrane factor (OMF) lipoprotein